MDASNILFRCSSLGHLMTESRSKTESISDTTKTHLIDVFVSTKYGRREEITGKFLDKGNEREEDSITLLSRVEKRFYKKNTTQLFNDFISGTPDLFLGKDVKNATETNDTKTSWSAHTFFRAQKDGINKMYYWQGMGYMALTKAKKHTVSYCLVNGTPKAIIDEKRKLAYSMGLIDTQNEEYKQKCRQIEINHIFNLKEFLQENPYFELDNNPEDWKYDIPMEERLYQVSFERDESEIKRLYDRIAECRNWMNVNLFKNQLQKSA